MISLNSKDIKAISGSRFWRSKNRANILWILFIVCSVAFFIIWASLFGKDTSGYDSAYTSESGQVVTISGQNVRLNGELLAEDNAMAIGNSARHSLIFMAPILGWGITGLVFLQKAEKYKDNYRRIWEKEKSISEPDD